ncbi:MAG TPA: hypothetical protein VFO82_04870 [Steroidobacteraceae bacterium]|nr:hypothetical protein [Steroidobacteraceae bacterium]
MNTSRFSSVTAPPGIEALRTCDATEHRWGQRIPLEVPVKIELGGRPMGHGLLRNASLSGGLIETALEVPVFTNLVVVLQATGRAASGSPGLAACVVRRETAGFAVEWRDMACPPIVELLEKHSGRRVANLREDEAYTTRRVPCAFASS